jgi:four helix bundle protein
VINREVQIKSYRDLIAWNKAMDLVCFAYQLTGLLPVDEKFGLIAQMRRAAISIPSNIAEGWGRHFGADYVRHLLIARGSIYELSTQSEICMRLRFGGEWQQMIDFCDELGRIVNGLIRSVERNFSRPAQTAQT